MQAKSKICQKCFLRCNTAGMVHPGSRLLLVSNAGWGLFFKGRIMKPITWTIVATGLLLTCSLLGGCSSGKTYGAVKFVTVPPGAEVINLKDDTNLGMTPVLVTWEGDEEKPEQVTVEFKKRGYKEEITTLWVNKRHATRQEAEAEPQPITVQLEKRSQ